MSERAGRVRTLGLRVAAALVPPLLIALIVWQHHVPTDVRTHSLDLTGDWSLRDGDGEAPWRTLRLPSQDASKELHGGVTWMRREVELPPELLHDLLYLHLGGFRSGQFEVFWNGQPFAQEFVLGGKRGWVVGSGLLKERNELAIRVQWGEEGDYGFDDGRWLLGRASDVQAYFERTQGTLDFVSWGVLFLTPFALIVLWVLRAQLASTDRREMYTASLIQVASGSLFVAGMTTSWLPRTLPYPYHLPVLALSTTGLLYGCIGFIFAYFQGSLPRYAAWSRKILLVQGALIVVCAALGQADLGLIAFGLLNLHTLAALFTLVVVIALSRNRTSHAVGARALLFSFYLVYALSGIVDILLELHLHALPRLVPFVTANLGIAVFAVVIVDFIQIAETNKGLTISLGETNAHLSEALAAAKESARVKGEFVANVSHELRTPLNAILNVPSGLMESFFRSTIYRCQGCASEFEPETDDHVSADTACPECGRRGTLVRLSGWRFFGDARESLRRLQSMWRSATHLLHLVDGVLDFSKLDAARMTLEVRPMSVRDALLGIVSSVSGLVEARKIKLKVVEPPESLEIRADPVRVMQILMNLAGNAAKFCEDGKSIEMGAVADGGVCRLWVRDEGIGIPKASLDLIFESFRQVESSHTRRYGGTGLGLSIAKSLVDLHDGRIWVESEEGKGATFFVELPIDGPAPQPGVRFVSDEHRLQRVFVIADDALALNALRLALYPLQLAFTGVSEPKQAPDLLRTQKPNLVIVDLVQGAAETWIAQLRQFTSAPILALRAGELHPARLQALGVATLQGHWRAEDLGAKVLEMLASTESQASADVPLAPGAAAAKPGVRIPG